MKKIKNSAIVLLMCVIALILVLIIIPKDKLFVKNCYKNNQDIFESLSVNFSKYYEPSLKYIQYDYDTNTFTKQYTDKEVLCDNKLDFINTSLNKLQNDYQSCTDYRVFSSVKSFYDDSGNMLMYFTVKSKTINKDGEKMIRHFYLVYIDKSYHGHGSNLSIDKFEINTEPFSGNWYYYSADTRMG